MFDRNAVLKRLPQAEPFVFVDNATVFDKAVEGSYLITGEEVFMGGHFPGRPIFPASILSEALGQLGIVYMMEHYRSEGIDVESIFFIKSEDVICRRKCIPGDRLDLQLKVIRVREPLILFSGSISVAGQLALKVSSLSLSFSTQGES